MIVHLPFTGRGREREREREREKEREREREREREYSLNVDVGVGRGKEDIGDKVILYSRIHLHNVASLATNIEVVDGDTFEVFRA